MSLRWKYLVLNALLFLFPMLALADSDSMSFSPPASDISVTFLGNIFGMVDGVLHGTGSQIMGVMFGVFNAGVLALGGIIITYIILVSTMNTAHEGQMLGQKWSSIWVPTRATIGLALLIPKASGYCLMQVFVMWVVLQGVGVADKIWGAALDYMNRGGVIIQADMSPRLLMGTGSGREIMEGAATMLSGEVCMIALQKQLETLRENYLDARDKDAGPCSGAPSAKMKTFCDENVPNFTNTVSPVTAYNDQHDPTNLDGDGTQETFTVNMPNFSAGDAYFDLHGICGTISFKGMDPSAMIRIQDKMASRISASDLEVIQKSRAAAVEQLFISLTPTASAMVNNDPELNSTQPSDDDESTVAADQFGMPLNSSYAVCSKLNEYCPNWGAGLNGSTKPVLLNGTELKDAVADYNAVMASALKLIDDSKDADKANETRKFITKAKERGWIMAGSYFFDLARLNGSADKATKTDSNTGLNDSSFSTSLMANAFQDNSCSGTYQTLCTWVTTAGVDSITKIETLIDGLGVKSPANLSGDGLDAISAPNYGNSSLAPKEGLYASTVYGYATNAALIDLAKQEGASANINVSLDYKATDLLPPTLETNSGKCKGGSNVFKQKFWRCFSKNGVYTIVNVISVIFLSWIVGFVMLVVNFAIQVFVVMPMIGFSQIFQAGVDILNQGGVNPIVALAKMGVTFINFSMNSWVIATLAAIAGSFAPPLYALMMMAAPIFFAWMGVMIAIGFVTAYFVPFLPYMIFTFGAIAWLISVIEAMVAAPIVALGVAHPEGHDALGKSEQGFMILLNVFLRPGMMVIGYIAAIAVSFVGVWIMNAGFQNVVDYLMSGRVWADRDPLSPIPWAKYFGTFFAALIYIMMYLTIVQKAFTLIAVLPDKVLRWIGGQPEGVGQETMQWSEETKSKAGEAGKATQNAGGAMQKQAMGMVAEGATQESEPGGSKNEEGSTQSTGGDPGSSSGSSGSGTGSGAGGGGAST
ncbi:MAG: type IVB secretion system protein DotA [Legionella sp.]|nr:type IVB secretion system protein DotA [Legionella sp.]